MAEHFGEVWAFEPAPDTFALLFERLGDRGNVRLFEAALLDRETTVTMQRMHRALTGRRVQVDGQGTIRAVALDTYAPPRCGLIKLDLEGAELLALQGARRTIRRHRPFLIVEETDRCRHYGCDLGAVAKQLRRWGYRQAFRIGVDVGYAP